MNFDKLKILANDEKEYWEARKVKLIREAIKNGHEMSAFIFEYSLDMGYDQHIAYCKKCSYQIIIEEIESSYDKRTHYYLIDFNANVKCTAI
jgi:hypothetical protein